MPGKALGKQCQADDLQDRQAWAKNARTTAAEEADKRPTFYQG